MTLGSYYDLPVVTNGRLTLGGRYYWKDRIYFSEFNLPIASQEAVGRFDLSLTYASPDDRWQIGAFARNLTDERVFNSIRVVSALLNSASLGRLDAGREIGVTVRTKF